MEALRESFIFHFDYIEDVPEELQPQYAMYAINYARYGTEPELTDWRDIKMWNKTKERIDGEFEKYEKKCSNLKNYKKSKELISDHDINAIQYEITEENNSRIDTESTPNRHRIDEEKTLSDTENEKSAGDTVSESESVTEFVTESESENEYVAQAPITESPSQAAYSKKLFEIFKNAGLPCANGNEITFLMRDFRNAMGYLHKTPGLSTLHSDDVIEACRNYAQVINSGQSYMTGKYSLDRFVTFKNFTDFLPGNFMPENFYTKGQGQSKNEDRVWLQKCPACGKLQMAWNNNLQKYICNDCKKTFSYEEVNHE